MKIPLQAIMPREENYNRAMRQVDKLLTKTHKIIERESNAKELELTMKIYATHYEPKVPKVKPAKKQMVFLCQRS